MALWRKVLHLGAVLIGIGMAVGCGSPSSGDVPVPRQHSYPRIAIPAAEYKTDTVGAVRIELNTAVATSSDNPDWLTAEYKGLNTKLFITLTPLDCGNADELIANRIERLSMNMGGAPTEVTKTVSPSGCECTLLVTPSGSPTPVQFLAIDRGQWMLSGSGMIDGMTAAPSDSLRPVVEMLHRDILHLLTTL